MVNQHNNLMVQYFDSKELAKRNEILNKLLCNMPDDGKDFFLKAFKKERYLNMKLAAVRGYAAYATEQEVSVLMGKLLELLNNSAKKTPYNYTEYEPMRSVFLMPYLLKHYNYACFQLFNTQLEKLYNDMPECFKNIFTLDEFGNAHELRDSEDIQKSWAQFWGREF